MIQSLEESEELKGTIQVDEAWKEFSHCIELVEITYTNLMVIFPQGSLHRVSWVQIFISLCGVQGDTFVFRGGCLEA